MDEKAEVTGVDKEQGNGHVSAEPTSEESSVVGDDIVESANNNNNLAGDDESESQKLPFSKGRCIALVATVTGASFLNVILQLFSWR